MELKNIDIGNALQRLYETRDTNGLDQEAEGEDNDNDNEKYGINFINCGLQDEHCDALEWIYIVFDCPAFYKLNDNNFSRSAKRKMKSSFEDICFEI